MAVAMTMHWPGLTSDQYDAVMAKLGLDANPPAGAVLHVATETDHGIEVFDVWQTEQAFNSFLEQRLLPVVSELGITGEPVDHDRSAAQPVRRRSGHDRPDRRYLASRCGRELGQLTCAKTGIRDADSGLARSLKAALRARAAATAGRTSDAPPN